MESGQVKRFDSTPGKMFGFITAPGGDIFFHFNSGRNVRPPSSGCGMPALVRDGAMREPRMGDRLVFTLEDTPKGPRAGMWAYESEYNAVLILSREEVTELVGGIGAIRIGLQSTTRLFGLSELQIGVFARNTPDGMKGKDLWKEFRRRQDENGADEYTFATFVREVLKEAGQPLPAY